MYPILISCDCSNNVISNKISQCKSCNFSDCSGNCTSINLKTIEQHIQNQVGVSQSQMIDVKSAIYIGSDYLDNPPDLTSNYPFKNMSDRRNASSVSNNNVPTRGNSVRSSITSNKPGSMVPGGKGVDVKHGSYARYLGKLKAPVVSRHNGQNNVNDTNIFNNKSYRFSIINNNCKCNINS
jgi:hypothetical protein